MRSFHCFRVAFGALGLGAIFLGGCASPPVESAREAGPLVFFNASPETVDRVVAELVAEAGARSAVVEQPAEQLILREVRVYPPGNSAADWQEHLIVSLRSEPLYQREAIVQLEAARKQTPDFEFHTTRLSESAYVLDYHSTSDRVRKWARIQTLEGGDLWITYVSRDGVDSARVRRWTNFILSKEPLASRSAEELAAGAEPVEFRSGPHAKMRTRIAMVTDVGRPARFRFMPGMSFSFRRDLTGVWARGRFQVKIGADGRVLRIDVRDVFPESAAAAMIDAMTDARFYPAEVAGQPAAAMASIDVMVRLLPIRGITPD